MTGSASEASGMVGRDTPLRLLTDLAGDARGGSGRSVLLSGEPGSGKTALVRAFAAAVPDFQLMRCHGVESEMELPYSALHELLLPLLPAIDELAAAHRRALDSALAMEGSDPASMVATAMAALTLIVQVAERAPVLLVIDDLQWIDAATLPILTFIARRIAHDPVLVLATSRAGDAPDDFEGTVVELSPLTAAETSTLAERHTGARLSDRAAAALTRATGGNPLAVIETLRLMGDDVEHLAADVSAPPPPSELIRRGFASRLAGLPVSTRDALTVVASALDDSADAVQSALRGLGLPADALDAAEAAGLVTLSAGSVTFVHPLLRALVYHECPAPQRRRTHAALASVSVDPGLRAWHAASATELPDEQVAADLEQAAIGFERRGGLRAAGRALERAARLSPNPEARARRLLRAGQVGRRVGSPAWVLPMLDEALTLAPDGRLQLLIQLERVTVEGHTDATASRLQERYLRIADQARGVDVEIETEALTMAAVEGPLTGSMSVSHTAVEQLRALPPSKNQVLAEDVVAVTATTLLLGGEDPALGAKLLVETATRRLGMVTTGNELVIEGLAWIEEFELASRLASNAVSGARRSDDVLTLLLALGAGGYVDYRRGALRSAESAFVEGLEVARASGAGWWTPLMTAYLALARAALGDDSSLALATQIETVTAHDTYDQMLQPYVSTARGLFHLGAGRPAAALPQLQLAATWAQRTGQREPGVLSWPADLVEAYEGTGNRAAALGALGWLRERAEATGRTWALASVARLEGLLADEGEYAAAYERAIELHERAGVPIDLARAHLSYGRRLQRSGLRSHARDELTAALQAFERLGAAAWREQAAAQLRGLGLSIDADPSSRTAAALLTPQEFVVAGSVARGLTNREAAAQLFLTTKTIEWHLRSIYRKLGIRSRVQLAQWMASEAPTPS